jgi:hypothetical protein
MSELRKVNKVSTSKVPLENTIGPVYKINALSTNAGLMVAGQMGIELGYKYFVMIDNNSFVSGYMYKGSGGVSTTRMFTVAYTNEESIQNKYNAYDCSTFMDGYTFTTHSGEVVFWTLFGASFVGGAAILSSAFFTTSNDPSLARKFIGGGILACASWLFTIPLVF